MRATSNASLPFKCQEERQRDKDMASSPSSSSRPHGYLPRDWDSCSVSRLCLRELEGHMYLPFPDFASSRSRLTSVDGMAFAEIPNTPHEREGMLRSIPLTRYGLPYLSLLWGLLEFYGIQIHHLTPGSILHISRFVALCEMLLGCEDHFDLWRKFLCLVPRSQGGTICELGGSEVWCIAGTGYPLGTLRAASEEWTSEWFYIQDVPLFDPARRVIHLQCIYNFLLSHAIILSS